MSYSFENKQVLLNKLFQLNYSFQVGDNIRLVCDYASGVDQVYSVKWYKDNMEFYR